MEDLADLEEHSISMKHEVQVADHHRWVSLVEEDSRLEEEGEEEMLGVIPVENGDICRGTVLITSQQARGVQMWLRQSQNHLDLW